MSSQVDRSPTQPMYVAWMLTFVAGFFILQLGIVYGVYYLLFGIPSFNDFVTQRLPMYSTTAFWKGRVWYPIIKVGPGSSSGEAILNSVDPVNGESSESKFKIPFPTSGLVTQRDGLWIVSPSVVTRIEGDELTEFKTTALLNRPSEPFLYEEQVAVVDMPKKGSPKLLVFQDKEWVEVGVVVIPSNFATTQVDGKTVLTSSPASKAASAAATILDIQTVSQDGKIHTFLSDGKIVLYREGLELAPVSALAPANVEDFPDLSNLADWEVACQVYPGIGMRGKHTWRGTVRKEGPAVVTIKSSGRNPFQNSALLAFARVEGNWTNVGEASTPASLDLIAVTDGEQTYVASESMMQTLRFLKLSDRSLAETGGLLKPPEPPFQGGMIRWIRIYQWAYWIGALVLALGVSRLMGKHLDAEYQFGLTTVELASVTRRYISRAIDYLVFLLPGFVIAMFFGLNSEEQVEKNIDKFFDMGAEGLMMRIIMFWMTYVIYALIFLIVTSFVEGKWGLSLGKWICGIRTVGSTLRPCGFTRAMVREILLVVETLITSALVPVTLIIAFTQCRQRIGDFVADTIVIRKRRQQPESQSDF